MKDLKYKLIKKLPFENSPRIGYISEPKPGTNGSHYWNHNWFKPEDYPEFWQPITCQESCISVGTRFYQFPHDFEVEKIEYGFVQYRNILTGIHHCDTIPKFNEKIKKGVFRITPKEYEILKIQDSFSGYEVIGYSTAESLLLDNPNNYSIKSIRRISDNEIFTIGDELNKYNAKIKYFTFVFDELRIVTDAKGNGLVADEVSWRLKDIEKKKVLFTTEDYVDIYEGDYYYFVNKDSLKISRKLKADKNCDAAKWRNLLTGTKQYCNKIYFSSLDKANKYVFNNTPVFTTLDEVDIFPNDKCYFIDRDDSNCNIIESRGNRKHNFKKFIYFSTYEAAKEYMSGQDRVLSLNDIKDMCLNGWHIEDNFITELEKLVKSRI